jgi:hypothetical protein
LGINGIVSDDWDIAGSHDSDSDLTPRNTKNRYRNVMADPERFPDLAAEYQMAFIHFLVPFAVGR